jgi:hypothetical protein
VISNDDLLKAILLGPLYAIVGVGLFHFVSLWWILALVPMGFGVGLVVPTVRTHRNRAAT